MQFQILKNGSPLTMGELDDEACAFWGVEISAHYARPKEYDLPFDWFNIIGQSIALMPQNQYDWSDIIAKILSLATICEKSFDEMIEGMECLRPFIELCLHWEEKGYVPVSY